MPRQEHTLRSLRSGAVMPDQSSRMAALSGRVATQARQQAGTSIRFPDAASRMRYIQGQVSTQQRQTIAPIPPTRPDPPTNVIGTRGSSGQIIVSFRPPAFDGDSPILDYTVYASPGGATSTGSSSPIIVAGLQNGTSYTFTVKARNAIGTSAASAPSAPVSTASPPEPPRNLVATRGNRSVSVSFDPPTDTGGEDINLYTATLYKVSDNSSIGSVDGLGSPLTIGSSAAPTITNGMQYYVKVSARTAIGTTESGPSNTVIPATTPAAPTGLITTAGNGYISIAFTAGNDGGSAITKYQYSLNDGTYVDRATGTTESPLVISGLDNGILYTVRIRAVNDIGTGTPSDPTTALPITVPAEPTNLVALTINSTSVVISFTAGTNGGSAITNYKYSIDDGATFTALSPADTSSPITIPGLSASTSYNIKLCAINVVGAGTASETLSITTNAPAPLSAPTNLSYTTGVNRIFVAFMQSPVMNPITNYLYSFDGSTFTPCDPEVLSSPIPIPIQNTSGAVYIRAQNSDGVSDPSEPLSYSLTVQRMIAIDTVNPTAWLVPENVSEVEYLIVGGGGAGGGAGGTGSGGGGGGGMVLTGSYSVAPSTTYSLVVGRGGTPAATVDGSGGVQSEFGTIVALGGGKGFGRSNKNESGIYSKGGAAQISNTSAATGGSGGSIRDSFGGGGGGGGAGSIGSDGIPGTSINATGGAGGDGISSSISGTLTVYGAGGRGGNEALGDIPGAAGAANTGNGGSGAQATSMGGSNVAGGMGGSGIVILKYYV